MKASHQRQLLCFTSPFLLLLLLAPKISSSSVNNNSSSSSRHLLQTGNGPVPGTNSFPNPDLQAAYVALQAWKLHITNDPQGITSTWIGFNVCSYRGVFCSPAPEDPCKSVVSGIDLNHGQLSGTLVEELGLLTHLSLFHINTNFFCGTIPESMAALVLLYELDVSNNQFTGPFPLVTLAMPSLAYLDLRFNSFSGEIPAELFNKKLDAIFLNNNQFKSQIPWNLGNSPISVANLANNFLIGAIPTSISNMRNTINELIFLNNKLDGCIPGGIGELEQLTVLDLSFNALGGGIPGSFSHLSSIEQLDLAFNLLSGDVLGGVCGLPRLQNLTLRGNFLQGEGSNCIPPYTNGKVVDDRFNCIAGRPQQRPTSQCQAFFAQDLSCFPLPPQSLLPSPKIPGKGFPPPGPGY